MGVNYFILHSLNADTVDFWGKNLKSELEAEGKEVFMPLFPIRAESSYEKFEKILIEYLKDGKLNENSVVIAHSIGNPYFIRFSEKYKFIPKVFISVAPGAVYEYPSSRNDYIVEIKKQAYLKPYELEYVKNNFKRTLCLHSDEDDQNSEKFSRFVEDTGAEDVYLSGYNHFDGRHRIYLIPELSKILSEINF